MRGALVGSGMVHLVLLILLFMVRRAHSLVIPGPDVVQVALVEPDATPEVTPVATPPPPLPKVEPPPRIKPTDEEGVKLDQPKKPKPKPPEPKPEPEKEAPPPPPARSLSLSSAAVGSAGLHADVGVDAPDFEFTYYLQAVRAQVAQNWSPPSGLAPGGPVARAVVYFRIARDGSVSGIQLERGSGFDFYDLTAVRAVTISQMPPLPLGFVGESLGVHFGFDYAAP